MKFPSEPTLKVLSLSALLAASLGAGSALAAPAADPGPAPQTLAFAGPDADLPPPPPGHDGDGRDGHHFRGMQRRGGPDFMPGFGERGPRMMHLLRGLDLSDAQEDAVDDIFMKHHKEQRELFKRGRDLHRAYAALDPQAKDYLSQSNKLADQAASLTRDSLKLRAKVDSELIATLTPEQARTLAERRAEREQRRQEHREQRSHDRGAPRGDRQ